MKTIAAATLLFATAFVSAKDLPDMDMSEDLDMEEFDSW